DSAAYLVRIRALDTHGPAVDQADAVREFVPDRACGPTESPGPESAFRFYAVWPDPAVSGVTLRFQIPDPSSAAAETPQADAGAGPAGATSVRLTIFDARGRIVRR